MCTPRTAKVRSVAITHIEFAFLAWIGLPAALTPSGEGIVSWIAQTFLQLVLSSVIMVAQNVQAEAGDVRSQHTYDDTVQILDRLDIHTQGGIKELADRLGELESKIRGWPITDLNLAVCPGTSASSGGSVAR